MNRVPLSVGIDFPNLAHDYFGLPLFKFQKTKENKPYHNFVTSNLLSNHLNIIAMKRIFKLVSLCIIALYAICFVCYTQNVAFRNFFNKYLLGIDEVPVRDEYVIYTLADGTLSVSSTYQIERVTVPILQRLNDSIHQIGSGCLMFCYIDSDSRNNKFKSLKIPYLTPAPVLKQDVDELKIEFEKRQKRHIVVSAEIQRKNFDMMQVYHTDSVAFMDIVNPLLYDVIYNKKNPDNYYSDVYGALNSAISNTSIISQKVHTQLHKIILAFSDMKDDVAREVLRDIPADVQIIVINPVGKIDFEHPQVTVVPSFELALDRVFSH